MPITIPNVPDKLTYAVVAAMGVAVLVAVLGAASGLVLGGLIALALAGATFWYVYRNLAIDREMAKRAAFIIAAIHAFFAVVSIAFHALLFFLLDAAMAACLAYAFMELNRMRAARG